MSDSQGMEDKEIVALRKEIKELRGEIEGFGYEIPIESKVMFGLKTVAKYLDISVSKVKEMFGKGMPYLRDESGMYITTKNQIDDWFQRRVEKENKQP